MAVSSLRKRLLHPPTLGTNKIPCNGNSEKRPMPDVGQKSHPCSGENRISSDPENGRH